MHKKARKFFDDQSGAMVVVMALLLVVVLAAAALGIDYGYMAWVQDELKKVAEAGALAGARTLGSSSNPDWNIAVIEADRVVKLNRAAGKTLTDCTVNYGYWSLTAQTLPLKPWTTTPALYDVPAIQVVVCKSAAQNGGPLQMLFAPIFGVQTVPVSAGAVAIMRQSGSSPFDYTIFSGSPSRTLMLNGSQTIKGSVHANDRLTINGSSNISGAAEGVNGVRVNGSNNIGSVLANNVQDITTNGSNNIGSQSGGAQFIGMPDYSQQIASTAAQHYSGNKIFNGSVDVSGSIYVEGNAILNGSVSSTGAILANGDIIVNGSATITGSGQVCLYSANGDILVNGSSFLGANASAIIYAPNGRVTINGSVHFHGRIVANEVRINGSGNFNGDDYPVTALPIGRKGAVLVK
jgi:cytoskeletal protein CcmA (bactofilin family)